MKPKTMYRIALVLGSQAAGLPATLFGIPVIASNNAPAQITLLDPSAMIYSDSGNWFDVRTQALGTARREVIESLADYMRAAFTWSESDYRLMRPFLAPRRLPRHAAASSPVPSRVIVAVPGLALAPAPDPRLRDPP